MAPVLPSGLVFGNLNNGPAVAGVGCSNDDNSLGNARWNICARISNNCINLNFFTSCTPRCDEN